MYNTNNPVEKVRCPLCNDAVEKLLYKFHVDSERAVLDKIKKDHPGWTLGDGLCSRCVDYYQIEVIQQQRLLPSIGPYFSIKSADDFIILPTGLRVDAHPRFTGKGVTICFIDSGFYPHPDLFANGNRIKEWIDITTGKKVNRQKLNTTNDQWHGTMTSVVCAGDGSMSNGLYKGIASDANLVLLKVQDSEGRITTTNIVKALQWVKLNHQKFNIRIINISVSDDVVSKYKESEVDVLAEELIEEGVTIVAAVGNDENGKIHAPANSPNVIAVGGADDNNILDNESLSAYHSAFGATTDGLLKPELMVHAIWIAAPILPGTTEQKEAAVLHDLLACSDVELCRCLKKVIHTTALQPSLIELSCDEIRNSITGRIQESKYISAHYMHVDGTSFSASVVSAIIAQLLEINRRLTPAMIREILFCTAKRVDSINALRQGFGLVQPRKAVLKVLKREKYMKHANSPHVDKDKKIIEFYIHNDSADQISLSGSFNHWAQDVLLLEPSQDGIWKIELPLLSEGKYAYKFLIDGKSWIEDVDNPYREPDGINGFNSILVIQN